MDSSNQNSFSLGSRQQNTREPFPKKERKMGREEKELTFLQYAMETSTIQGPAKIWAVPVVFLKVMWLLFLGIATGMMLYQLVLLFQQYFQWPIQTEVSLGFSPLPLPAVTICNANAVRLSQASKLSCFLQAALDVPRSYQDPVCLDGKAQLNGTYDFSHLACVGDCDGSLGNSSKKQFVADVGFAKSSRESLKEVGHQAEDMILDCSIAGRSCGYRNFTHSLSYDYGNCFTLSLPNIKMTRSGPLQVVYMFVRSLYTR